MSLEEIMNKGKEFAEWQKETGGTAEEYLEYLEKNCPKKNRRKG